MKVISSRQTIVFKWILPVLFGLWIIGVMVAFATGGVETPEDGALVIATLVVLAVVLGWTYSRLIWPVADRVEDAGEALVVHRRGVQARIPIGQIMNVSVNLTGKPRRIALRLRTPGPFGDEIVFLPPSGFSWPFARDPIAEDLIVRVDRARGGTRA
jgi:hypothetical protein